jgi:hypothetical protein
MGEAYMRAFFWVRRDFEERACARSSRRTPDSMQRGGRVRPGDGVARARILQALNDHPGGRPRAGR